jgi:glycosidase
LAGRCADVTLVLGPTGLRLGELCGLPFGTWSPCRVPDGQWYLHLFTPQQPDLNWDNPEVRQEFLTTLAFWADRGVDGFRIDVAHMLAKDLSRPMPSHLEVTADIPLDGSHRFYDRDQVHEIYAEWRRLFDSYDPPRMAVAEAWVPAERRRRYASPEGLGQAFNFDLLQAPWSAEAFGRSSTRTSPRHVRPPAPRPGCSPTTTWSVTPPDAAYPTVRTWRRG